MSVSSSEAQRDTDRLRDTLTGLDMRAKRAAERLRAGNVVQQQRSGVRSPAQGVQEARKIAEQKTDASTQQQRNHESGFHPLRAFRETVQGHLDRDPQALEENTRDAIRAKMKENALKMLEMPCDESGRQSEELAQLEAEQVALHMALYPQVSANYESTAQHVLSAAALREAAGIAPDIDHGQRAGVYDGKTMRAEGAAMRGDSVTSSQAQTTRNDTATKTTVRTGPKAG